VSWNPVEVDARIASKLIIANAALEGLNEPFIPSTSTVVVAKGIVNDATVSVDMNIATVAVSAANLWQNGS
jgi:hypothetical protein